MTLRWSYLHRSVIAVTGEFWISLSVTIDLEIEYFRYKVLSLSDLKYLNNFL